MKKFILKIIYGTPKKGEPINLNHKIKIPFKTTELVNKLPENEWCNEVKFGSRYGTKGSFYQRGLYQSYF
jgi:hypothetical protein